MRYRRVAFKIFIGISFLMFTSTPLWSGESGELVKSVILKDISLKDGEITKERKLKLWGKIHLLSILKRWLKKQWESTGESVLMRKKMNL